MKKNNIFAHIIYEFEMYLFTFSKMAEMSNSQQNAQALYNACFDSHLIHLRNLIEFFNNEKSCINVNFLLNSGNNSFSVLNPNNYYKHLINKTCDHLTKERYENATIDTEQITMINNVYSNVCSSIKAWLSFILSTPDLKPSFYTMLQDEKEEIRTFANSLM